MVAADAVVPAVRIALIAGLTLWLLGSLVGWVMWIYGAGIVELRMRAPRALTWLAALAPAIWSSVLGWGAYQATGHGVTASAAAAGAGARGPVSRPTSEGGPLGATTEADAAASGPSSPPSAGSGGTDGPAVTSGGQPDSAERTDAAASSATRSPFALRADGLAAPEPRDPDEAARIIASRWAGFGETHGPAMGDRGAGTDPLSTPRVASPPSDPDADHAPTDDSSAEPVSRETPSEGPLSHLPPGWDASGVPYSPPGEPPSRPSAPRVPADAAASTASSPDPAGVPRPESDRESEPAARPDQQSAPAVPWPTADFPAPAPSTAAWQSAEATTHASSAAERPDDAPPAQPDDPAGPPSMASPYVGQLSPYASGTSSSAPAAAAAPRPSEPAPTASSQAEESARSASAVPEATTPPTPPATDASPSAPEAASSSDDRARPAWASVFGAPTGSSSEDPSTPDSRPDLSATPTSAVTPVEGASSSPGSAMPPLTAELSQRHPEARAAQDPPAVPLTPLPPQAAAVDDQASRASAPSAPRTDSPPPLPPGVAPGVRASSVGDRASDEPSAAMTPSPQPTTTPDAVEVDDHTVIARRRRPAWALEVEGGGRYPLTGDAVTLGRATTAQSPGVLGVHDRTRTLSKRHATLFRRDDGWWVRDLGSTNGTYLRDADGGERAVENEAGEPVDGDLVLGDLVARIVTGEPER